MSRDEGDNTSLNSLSSLIRNEDESATTTSTESDTFESWTLITDKQRPKKTTEAKPTMQRDDQAHAEDDINSIPVKTTTEQDKEQDDFSDGISIISESGESVGRFSPHPLLREQLHNMLPEEPLPTLFNKSSIFSRIEPLDSLDTDEEQQHEHKEDEEVRRHKPSASTMDTALQQTDSENCILKENQINTTNILAHPLIKSGVSAIFYALVTLALLSFVGRLRNPEWDLSAGKSLSEFEQKINNLELQHNLMIAEIDLLSKQVKYLTELSAPGSQTVANKKNFEQKSAKKFKAWPGNGRNIDPVEINKEDLKRAYKCSEDDNFVEIAGVCVDKATVYQEPLVEQVGNVVNDMLQDSETYKSFEKVAEAFLNKGNEEQLPAPPTNEQMNDQTENPTVEQKYREQAYKNKYEGQAKKAYFKKHSNEHDDDSEEDDDKDDNDSKAHRHDNYKDNSKERYNKQNKYAKKSKANNRYNSKERFDKKQHKPSSSEERKDPYWHEKLMQQREELRRQRVHNNANNWYIERGDSREQARSS